MHTMRTITLILLGCVAGAASVLAGLILWLGAVVGTAIAMTLAAALVTVYVLVVGPWQRRWGATAAEVTRRLPGDEILPVEAPTTTRAITIEATPDAVFPWLLQIGYGRGGWYSYDWIDNDGKPSVEGIDPALRLEPGDRIEMLPGFGPVVREIEPPHHIVSAGDHDSWCLLVEPIGDGRSRLLSRWRQDWPKTVATRLWICIVDPGAFVMEQKMLRDIRKLAERSPASLPNGPSDVIHIARSNP
ncbi:MAG: hypothetical protein ACJ76P_08415 [Actinomycetota bacterium]